MKKVLSLVLALALVLSCSAALASEPVTLVYAEVNPLDTIVGKTATFFKEKVEELTGGSVLINIQHSGVLGTEAQVLDGILSGSGTVDIGRFSAFQFTAYGCNKAKLLSENPMQDLDAPHLRKSLPKYLDLEESVSLLDHVDGANQARDYCILTLFLNCGLRISELVGLNVTDVRDHQLRVLGKGNKERMLFLNDACRSALDDWLVERSMLTLVDQNALFVTLQNRRRISRAAVHKLVKKHLAAAGLDSTQYSAHKLRHTAATLMLQNGVDVRTLQEVLGHDHLNTTQIYTHVDNDDLRTAARANPLAKVRKKGRAEPQEDPGGET